MGKAATLVYDTEPLTLDISMIADYTSLHLYSAVSAQLFRWNPATRSVVPAACETATSHADGRVHRFSLDAKLSWNDFTQVSPWDYVRRFEDLFAKKAPITTRFTHLRTLTVEMNGAGKEELVFELASPDPHFCDKLAHPSTGPLSSSAKGSQFPFAAGPFRFTALGPAGGILEHTSCPIHTSNSTETLNVRFIDDPAEAIRLYEHGIVDATCPANFPLDRVHEFSDRPDFHHCATTTFFVLIPSSRRAECRALRRAVACCISQERLRTIAPAGLGYMDSFVASQSSRAHREFASDAPLTSILGTSLRLACDQFQPNRQILGLIADDLRRHGASIETVVDSYAKPAEPCDFRLVVMVNSLAYPADAYRRLIMASPFRDDPELNKEYRKAIEYFDSAISDVHRAAAIHRLDEILWRELPVIPLVALRQFALKRDSLTTFSWEANFSS